MLLAEGLGGRWVRHRWLVADSTAPGLVAQLEGWCAIRIPLLLIIEEMGEAQLSGPEATVTGLHAVSERV